MLIVSPGTIPNVIPPPWWVGQRPQCAICNTVIELEPADAVRERQGRNSPRLRYVMVTCPFCDSVICHEEVVALTPIPLH